MGTFLAIGAAAIAIVLIYAATRPNTFRFERSTVINAPPEKIFPLLNDFRAWATWSPYERKDPNMQREFGGAAMGVGSTYAWEGNKTVGKGRMEITESTPPSKVVIAMHFMKPFEARHGVSFELLPQGNAATAVTWAMYGERPFMVKLMCLVFSMEKMMEPDFQAGLRDMKAAAEK